jgi:hypothetical protein
MAQTPQADGPKIGALTSGEALRVAAAWAAAALAAIFLGSSELAPQPLLRGVLDTDVVRMNALGNAKTIAEILF